MTAVPWGVPFFILPLIALIDTLLCTCINFFYPEKPATLARPTPPLILRLSEDINH